MQHYNRPTKALFALVLVLLAVNSAEATAKPPELTALLVDNRLIVTLSADPIGESFQTTIDAQGSGAKLDGSDVMQGPSIQDGAGQSTITQTNIVIVPAGCVGEGLVRITLIRRFYDALGNGPWFQSSTEIDIYPCNNNIYQSRLPYTSR